MDAEELYGFITGVSIRDLLVEEIIKCLEEGQVDLWKNVDLKWK